MTRKHPQTVGELRAEGPADIRRAGNQIETARAMLAEINATIADMDSWDGTPEGFETIKENLRAMAFRARAAGLE